MTAGISILLPLRSLSRPTTKTWAGTAVIRVCPQAAHAITPLPRPSSTMSMFKRAHATYTAQNKAPQPANNLAKQLFPSSSPSPMREASIKDQFQKTNGASNGSAKFSQSSKTGGPLQPRTSNSSQPMNPPQQVKPTVNSKSFASLYNSQNSFEEGPDVIDLTGSNTQTSTRGHAVNEIDYFDDDDFSDEIDLDYECPSALPPLKPESTPAKKTVDAPPTDNTSVLSWSQSSPTHFKPAQSVSQSTDSQRTSKRAFTEDIDAPSSKPIPKKRSLPPQYLQKKENDAEPPSTFDTSTPASKPQAKPKESRTWDLTPGAIKEQQKLFKNKSKKTGAPGGHASAEEVQQAIKSYTVKQSAISLSNEQEHVKKLVCEKGQSVFFTGPAGTGKSVLMRAIIQELKKKYAKDQERLAVTASTGLAACNIGGMTLHSFAGIGLGKDDAQTLVKKIRRNPKAKNRWMRTRVLIVDEISMVDGDLFDKLSQVGRIIRNNGRPWGGIQLVITGDFFQLPPVPDRETRDTKFAFEAATWNTSIDHTIGLTEVFRQKDPGRHFTPFKKEEDMSVANTEQSSLRCSMRCVSVTLVNRPSRPSKRCLGRSISMTGWRSPNC